MWGVRYYFWIASNPTVGNLMDKLEPLGVHLCFGETSELTGMNRFVRKEVQLLKLRKIYEDLERVQRFHFKEATDDLSESQLPQEILLED